MGFGALVAALGTAVAAETSKVGDLTGNLPWTVYLLIPLLIVLALLTAFALGTRTDPPPVHRRQGRVTRALDDRTSDPDAAAPPSP